MGGGRGSKIWFSVSAGLVLLFLYIPLFLIVLYAFNKTTVNSWPFPGFSTRWFVKLWRDPAPKDAAKLSLEVAAFSTVFALVLRTGMAFAFGERGGDCDFDHLSADDRHRRVPHA